MDAFFAAQSGRARARSLYQFNILAWLALFLILPALRLAAQTPQPLVVTTIAGLANFGTNDGIAAAAKFLSPTAVAVDAFSNVYVADPYNDNIRKITASGIVTTVAGAAQIPGTNDGPASGAHFNGPYGLAVDTNGNVYVADTANSTIRKISFTGVVTTYAGLPTVAGFRDGLASQNTNFGAVFNQPYGIAIGPSNIIYVADTFNHLIRTISFNSFGQTNVTTLAGDNNTNDLAHGTNSGLSDGLGTNARFLYPQGLTVDGAGNVYVADSGNHCVRKITPAGLVSTLTTNTSAPIVSLLYPRGIGLDAGTNLYISDFSNHVVLKLLAGGTNWFTWAGGGLTGTQFGDGDGIDPGQAAFFYPWGIALDQETNIYVADSGNGNVRQVQPLAIPTIITLAGPDGSYGLTFPSAAGLSARFHQPWGLALDPATNLYISDSENNCILEMSTNGIVTFVAGNSSGVPGSSDGSNNIEGFDLPSGICIDGASNIYVADFNNSTIRMITPMPANTNWVTITIAGQAGVNGSSNGMGTNALFKGPVAVALDSATNLYVVDEYNNAIRMITPGGVVSLYAGNPNANSGYVDANGTNALFDDPRAIAVDSATNLYIADFSNNAIRMIDPFTNVTTLISNLPISFPDGIALDSLANIYIANSGANTIMALAAGGKASTLTNLAGLAGFSGSSDGYDTSALFVSPVGLTVDGSGNVYIADTLNNTIRKGIVYVPGQTAVLTINSSPGGLPVTINGTNFTVTPQVSALTIGGSVSLVASVPSGFFFTNWTSNGVVVSTSTNYSYTIGGNVTNIAVYLPTFDIIPTVSPGGSGVATPIVVNFLNSSNVVTATNNTGYLFTNWTVNGQVITTSTNLTVLLTSNTFPVANFLPASSITVTASAGGTATIGGTNYNGTTNTLTATTNGGFAFINWTLGATNGPVLTTSNTYSFVLTSNVALFANFLPTYTVMITNTPGTGGTATGAGTYIQGSNATVVATTNGNFAFISWNLGATNGPLLTNSNSYSFTVTSNTVLFANYLPTFQVTVDTTSGGTATPGGRFIMGTNVTFTAAPNANYAFVNWTLSTSNGVFLTNSTNFNLTVTSNTTLSANFLPIITVNLTAEEPGLNNQGGGILTGAGSYTQTSNLTATATANTGFRFINWTLGATNGTVLGTSNTLVYAVPFVPTLNLTIFGNFLPLLSFSVTNSPTNGGSIQVLTNGVLASGSATNFTNIYGSANQVVATEGANFVFSNWLGNGVPVSTSANYIFNLTSNVSLQANYSTACTLTVSSSPAAGGTVTGAGLVSGTGKFATNALVSLLATTNRGYAFSNWTYNIGGGAFASTINPLNSYKLTSNTVLVANFVTTPQQIQVFNGTNATNLIPNGDTTQLDFGTVQPNSNGLEITFVVSNIGGRQLNLTSITVPSNYTIVANSGITVSSAPWVIAPLTNGIFMVQMNTTTTGVYSGQIGIINNDPINGNFTFDVTGTVVPQAPRLQVLYGTNLLGNGQTNAINFGNVQQGQPGPIITFLLENPGELPLTVSNVTVPTGFLVVTNPPPSIVAGGSGILSVQLDTVINGTASGSVTIVNSDPTNNPFVFPVTAFVGTKIIALTGSLNFGVLQIGSVAQGSLTISNAGNLVMTVTGINLPSPVLTGAFSGTIPGGGTQVVPIAFAPTSATNYGGNITVFADNTSGANTIAVTAFGVNTNFVLTVITSGNGKVTGAPTPPTKILKSGTPVTLKAVPGGGSIFAEWVGTYNTNKNPLTFKMITNTIVEANFVTNPFIPFVGAYNGLFSDSGGVISETTAGMLKGLTVKSNGMYSGSLLLNGASRALSGTFNALGQTTNTVGKGTAAIAVVMTLTSNDVAPQVVGSVTASGLNATNLLADRATNSLGSGNYTLLIQADTNVPSVIGEGYALITNYPGTVRSPSTAAAKITGALPDGTSFSQSVPVSEDGFVPIYASLYGGKGLLLGWINLEPTNGAEASVSWFHPPRTGLFTAEFTSTNLIALSPWTNPPVTGNLPTNLVVVETSGTTPVTNNAYTISITNGTLGFSKLTGPATALSGTIATKTGLVKVTIGSGSAKATGYGVVLLNGTNGGGYYVTKTNAGPFQLNP